jgi:hypothetical protein
MNHNLYTKYSSLTRRLTLTLLERQSPWIVLCIKFCYTPSVGVIGLAEYVCIHLILTFTVEDPDYVPEDNE